MIAYLFAAFGLGFGICAYLVKRDFESLRAAYDKNIDLYKRLIEQQDNELKSVYNLLGKSEAEKD